MTRLILSGRLLQAFILVLLLNAPVPIQAADGTASEGYQSLVELFEEFIAFRDTGDAGADFSAPAVARRLDRMQQFQARIDAIDIDVWDRSRQVDYLAVRSRLNQYDFNLQRIRPWARDPGFYVDQMLWVTFTNLPVEGAKREEFLEKIRAIPVLVSAAQRQLNDVAADYADLAIHNLNNADGVGHGHPYRGVPPAGVLGWYDDLLERAAQQPELKDDIQAARSAVQAFDAWLQKKRPTWNASAGVGEAAFDWYLKHVKLMPWTSAELVVLGQRELDRLWAVYALERHRNRELPELQPAGSAEDYQQRIVETDRRIRQFLLEQNIITVPGDIGELDTNAPWIVRPGGRNFWEEIQFRDPSPDHLHAVIPGHRFDAIMNDRVDNPIRRKIDSGARAEGWATYLEEAMLQAGIFEDLPRVRELIQIFGIFRAARVPADVWLQSRQMSVSQVVDYWLERVPYLDRNVARVDAEIYLRWPPGYGVGYSIGMLQMQRLLADRKRQLGNEFELQAFHDDFMAYGWLPLSLIRWDMTGLDDEVMGFWEREPIPNQAEVSAGDAIKAVRAASNQAIVRQDVETIVSYFDQEYSIITGSGVIETGRESQLGSWREHFEQLPDVVYVRSPTDVTLSEANTRAIENGSWVGTWTSQGGPQKKGGRYTAYWRNVDGNWKIRSELFVTLTCSGSDC